MAKKKPIVSPLGQWAYPGEVTIIPSSNITMKGVNYPVLGVDDLGNSQMMMPGQDYTFPGDYVTEIPQMGKGGLRQWFAEEWTDVKTGKPCGRSGKEKGSRPYPACRPKKRVNETTPKTTSEMSSAEKAKFKREKTSGKRIDYNHKRREFGGESWLDQYQRGGISDNDLYKYDKQGNLSYRLPIVTKGNDTLDAKESKDEYLYLRKLNPTLEEFINVASPYYPIDNKLVTDSEVYLQPSNYQRSLEEDYVLPQMVGKSFGTLPIVKDDGYSPNRRWVSNLRGKDPGSQFAADKYAYVLKTDPSNLVDRKKKKEIENLYKTAPYYDLYTESIDNNKANENYYLYLSPNGIWRQAEQMRIEMRNNPEIKDWANLHNVNLDYENRKSANDMFAPKIPESIYAKRLADAGLPTNRPDYLYSQETYIVQDPSKFNLAGYFPMNSILKESGYDTKPFYKKDRNERDQQNKLIKQSIAEQMGVDPSTFDNGEYLIHYNQSPITEYTPGKKYGGWLSKYQSGGLYMGDYDLTRAPKRGDYLLPDINRPSYIDEAGNKRSEYRMGKNIDGKETLIPTVVGGKQLSEDEALDRYYKTGLHMGQFNNPEEADYASRLRTARYNMLEDPIRFKADQFQDGGWANFVPASSTPLLRKDVSGNAGYRDNTRVNTINPATKKAAEAAQYARRVGSISQGKTKSDYEKAKEASSFVSQAEQRKGSADPLDYVLDFVNPATYGFAGTDLVGNTAMGVNNLAKGNFSEAAGNALNAGMNALYLLPTKGLAKTIASPIAFTPVEGMMYRGIGKEGFKDAVQSGVFRPKQLNYSPGRSLAERVATPKQFSRTYYAPAKKFGVVENYGPEYLAEVSFEGNPFGKRYGRKDWSWSTSKQIPINEGRILKKDWLRGYKPVDVSSLQSISKPKNYFDEFDNLTYEGTTDLYESIPHPYYKGPVQEAVDLWQDYKYVSPELENAFTINTKSSVPVTRYLKEKPQFDEEGYLISKGPTSFAVGPGNKNFGENRIFLNIPENTRVAPISKGASNTNFQRERELLLPSNTKYRKVNSRVNPETGLEDYYMEIVPKKQGGQTSWLNKYK